MCSAPNVYMFVYILIGTHMVPLSVGNVVSAYFKTMDTWLNEDRSYIILYLCLSFLSLNIFYSEEKNWMRHKI